MIKIIHPMAGALALLTIVTFWLSLPFSELFASDATVTAVKTGFLLLIPALAAAGGSGLHWNMFYAVQALELAAGAASITLFGLNMRDGLKMKGWLRRGRA